jgi:hypothetical protein
MLQVGATGIEEEEEEEESIITLLLVGDPWGVSNTTDDIDSEKNIYV